MLRTPVILLLVPMLIPEVPGEALYYTMYYLVQGYQEEFGTYSVSYTHLNSVYRFPGFQS